MLIKKIFIILFFSQISFADIKKTISSNIKDANYISYSLTQSDFFSIYRDNDTFNIDYQITNFRLNIEKNNGRIRYKMKILKNNIVYFILWGRKNKKNEYLYFTYELNPKYTNINFSNTCNSSSKNPLDDFDLEKIGRQTSNNANINFSNTCNLPLEKMYGSNFKKIILSDIIDVELWNDEPAVQKISNNIKNKTLLANSRRGLDDFKNQNRKIASVNCSDEVTCENLGDYSPVKNEITLYINCINNSEQPKCSLVKALNEEILHNLTGVGNEIPDHSDLKVIAEGISDCGKFQIELDSSTSRPDFNQQTKIDIRPEQLPQPPPPPENLSQPFTLNPATDKPRTVVATEADMSFIRGFKKTFGWATDVATKVISIAEKKSTASIKSNPRRPASSMSQLNSPELSTSPAASQKSKNSSTFKTQNENSILLGEETQANPETSAHKAAQSNELPRGKSISQQPSPNSANQPIAIKANSPNTTKNSPQRNTASIPPIQPIDASTLAPILPQEISQIIKDSKISVADFVSRLKNNPTHQQILKRNKITIITNDQTLGETDSGKARVVYRYSESGNKPRLIKIEKNLPTNI